MAKRATRALEPDHIIGWLSSVFRTRSREVLAGVGEDDCGVLKLGTATVVISADFLNATPIAEQLGIADERVLGRLAVAATLSDLLGSGAIPKALIVGVTVPHGYPENQFRQLMRGVHLEATKWNVSVIGGDTKLGASRALLTCGLGTVRSSRELFISSKARVGDVIMASGFLGTCAAATLVVAQAVEKEQKVPAWARRAITVPSLPWSRSGALARLRVANGGIDVSDGFAIDLTSMCVASGVGAVVDVASIPVSSHVRRTAVILNVPPWTFPFASGGDFQFLVTVPKRNAAQAARLGFTAVGRVTRDTRMLICDAAGRTSPMPSVGHRDRHRQQFSDEITQIVNEIARGG